MGGGEQQLLQQAPPPQPSSFEASYNEFHVPAMGGGVIPNMGGVVQQLLQQAPPPQPPTYDVSHSVPTMGGGMQHGCHPECFASIGGDITCVHDDDALHFGNPSAPPPPGGVHTWSD